MEVRRYLQHMLPFITVKASEAPKIESVDVYATGRNWYGLLGNGNDTSIRTFTKINVPAV